MQFYKYLGVSFEKLLSEYFSDLLVSLLPRQSHIYVMLRHLDLCPPHQVAEGGGSHSLMSCKSAGCCGSQSVGEGCTLR